MRWTLLLIGGMVIGAAVMGTVLARKHPPEVKVGILHSLSGTMQISEKEVAMITIAAFDEINEKGGILGHHVIPLVADGASDTCRFAQEARRLINQEGVKALFGCWTSSSRKAVKPIVEQNHSLLFYPIQYEGFEASQNIVYLGQVPNQQIRPAIKYAIDHFGKRFYLVGSDYLFPHAANRYIKELGAIMGVEIVGETYIPMGGADFGEVVKKIKARKPAVILNTLNGESNLYFFRELYDQKIRSSDIPVISFSIGDTEIRQMGKVLARDALAGHYASWSYFASVRSDENKAFKLFLKKHRIDFPPSDAMEAAYNGAYIYKQAVEECGSFDPRIVLRCLPMQSFNGPGGIIYIDPSNNHAWKDSRIGRITSALEFRIVFDSMRPIRPENYPVYKSVYEWDRLLSGFDRPLRCEER